METYRHMHQTDACLTMIQASNTSIKLIHADIQPHLATSICVSNMCMYV